MSEVLIISLILFKSNWFMDTGVCDLDVAFFKANSTWFNDIQYVAKIYQIGLFMLC